MGKAESEAPTEEAPRVLSTAFGSLEIDTDATPEDVERNLRALSWIEEIVEDSNGALTYAMDDTNRLIVVEMTGVEIIIDVRLCAQRSLSSNHWFHGHVPASVNGREVCINMSDEYYPEVPDLDLCASLLLLLTAEGVSHAMLPSTLYAYLPLENVRELLLDSNCDVVESALASLGQRSCRASLSLLKDSISQASSSILVFTAVEALLMGRDVKAKPYMPLLVELTNSQESDVKARAIELFCFHLDTTQKEYIPILKRLVHFSDMCVPAFVLRPYAQMAGSEAIEDLLSILDHRDSSWHEGAVRALMVIDHPLAMQALSAYAMVAMKEIREAIFQHLRMGPATSLEETVAAFIVGLKNDSPAEALQDLSSLFD